MYSICDWDAGAENGRLSQSKVDTNQPSRIDCIDQLKRLSHLKLPQSKGSLGYRIKHEKSLRKQVLISPSRHRQNDRQYYLKQKGKTIKDDKFSE